MKNWALALVLLVTACGSTTATVGVHTTPTSPSSAASAPASPTLSADRSPSPTPPSPVLTCSSAPRAGHTLAVLHEYAPTPKIDVLDLADPLRPIVLCAVTNVDVAQLISPTTLAIAFGTKLGVADLASRSISVTAALPAGGGRVVFSPDGSSYAYGTYSDTAGATEYLVVGGTTHKLYNEPPIGGHDGPPWGPVVSQAFSPDGEYFTDYSIFRTAQGVAQTHVFRRDGSKAFDAASGEFPVWLATGSRMLYLAGSQADPTQGDLHSWDPINGDVVVKRGVTSYVAPSIAPDATSIVYEAFDTYAKGGLPHVWQLNLSSGARSQISKVSASTPLFVSRDVVWVDEQKPCDCPISNNTGADGNVLAHDLRNGTDSHVVLPISMQGAVVELIGQVLIA